MVILAFDFVQRAFYSAFVVQTIQGKRVLAVPDFNRRQHRNVARTLRHYRDELAPRLSAVVVGDVFADDVRLVNVSRYSRILFHLAVFVRPVCSDHLDF